MKTMWSIGGHDPNAVAGIQADLLTAQTLGVKSRTLIASFTAQSDRQVTLNEAVPEAWLKAQWDTLLRAERPGAIKLGLLNHTRHLQFLREALRALPDVPVIADPVFASSSGHAFTEQPFIDAWRELLISRVTLLTPNIPEAEQLLGYRLSDRASITRAAAELRSWGLAAVLIKGGHSQGGEDPADYFDDGQRPFWLHGKLVAKDYRGTGCSLATAIAAEMSQGLSLRDAVITAHAFLQDLIQSSASSAAAYLQYEKRTFTLPGLSYALPKIQRPFPAIDAAGLGFYPIVADLNWLKRLVSLGVPSIQLRLKDLTEAERQPIIDEAIRCCRSASVRLFINDFWEQAAASGAYGVHLGQEDLDLLSEDQWQRLQTSGLRLGISTHCYEEAARAIALKPSYIALGPIFETTCKSMAFGPQGMERVKQWHQLCGSIPVVAIGGLQLQHAQTLLGFGASGIAVISDLQRAQDPEARTRAWLAQWT